MDFREDNLVGATRESPRYCSRAPYDPSECYPEWPGAQTGSDDNSAYRGVRNLLASLGFDRERFGSAAWNPLREMIRPGDTVVVKPNMVADGNAGVDDQSGFECLVTHGSVLRVVLDYVGKALSGTGKVVIADCPLQGSHWERLLTRLHLPDITADCRSRFQATKFVIRDYRLCRATLRGRRVVEQRTDETRLEEYCEVDLGQDSLLTPLHALGQRFGVADYPHVRLNRMHGQGANRYLIHRDFLEAAAFINLPKMKCHMKSGITGALKNLVGINGHKDYLPHFCFGGPGGGGDEYEDESSLSKFRWSLLHRSWELDRGPGKALWHRASQAVALTQRLAGASQEAVTRTGGGSWHGNDTLWRTILDLNRTLFYCDRWSRQLAPELQFANYLAILDGIVAGEGEGPLAPEPKPAGWLLAGRNPVAVDAVAAACMGFDPAKISHIARAFELGSLPLARFAPRDIVIRGHAAAGSLAEMRDSGAYTPFRPSRGFRGHIEFSRARALGEDT